MVQSCVRLQSWYGLPHAPKLLILAVRLLVAVAEALPPRWDAWRRRRSLLLKRRLSSSVIRCRQRAQNLISRDRFLLRLTAVFVRQQRSGESWLPSSVQQLCPSSITRLINRKYSLLFSSSAKRRRPRSEGALRELVAAISAN